MLRGTRTVAIGLLWLLTDRGFTKSVSTLRRSWKPSYAEEGGVASLWLGRCAVVQQILDEIAGIAAHVSRPFPAFCFLGHAAMFV